MNRNPTQLLALAGIALATVLVIVVSIGRSDEPAASAPEAPETIAAVGTAAGPLTADTSGGTTEGEPDPATRPDDAEPDAPSFVPPDLGAVPEIVDISGWLNTDGTSFDEVRDTVTIVQFWTFGCHNCRATLPHLQDLYAARHDDGLEIVGIHAHEFDRERDPGNVAEAVVDLGVTWPVALDTNKTNFVAWQGSPRYWPRTYVIDADGRVRFDHIGEGDYDELAATVDALLAEHEAAAGPA